VAKEWRKVRDVTRFGIFALRTAGYNAPEAVVYPVRKHQRYGTEKAYTIRCPTKGEMVHRLSSWSMGMTWWYFLKTLNLGSGHAKPLMWTTSFSTDSD